MFVRPISTPLRIDQIKYTKRFFLLKTSLHYLPFLYYYPDLAIESRNRKGVVVTK